MKQRINITLPALNEELVVRSSAEAVIAAAKNFFPEDDWVVVVADNGSVDKTEEYGRQLAATHPNFRYLRLAERGKGLGVLAAWAAEPADIYVFMDIDLATDLEALPALIAAVRANGGVAVGSRYHAASQVTRSPLRRLFSLGYRALLYLAFQTSVSDLPCGFKAISRATYDTVVPKVTDRRWFFDTELVIRAEQAGFKVAEIPVIWREETQVGRRSLVNTRKLAWEYFCKVIELRRHL